MSSPQQWALHNCERKEIQGAALRLTFSFCNDKFSSFVSATPLDINELNALLRTDAKQTTPIELLVLSACQTATGDDRAALGLAGVAVRAGARSTLASLWFVNDEATAELMANFYAALTQSESPTQKAEALRQAQLMYSSATG